MVARMRAKLRQMWG